jgi:hypothetical protein
VSQDPDSTSLATGPIGGPVSTAPLPPALIPSKPRDLTPSELWRLWPILVQIGKQWGNLGYGSAAIRSSWLEFLDAKTTKEPSYVGEYVNALVVMRELKAIYGGEYEAFKRLLFDNGIPPGDPTTRVAHVKRFVVDEFIKMQVVAGGFRGFVRPKDRATGEIINYNGFVGGSRFNRIRRVRSATPPPAGGTVGGGSGA